jgi:hypothetical protein
MIAPDSRVGVVVLTNMEDIDAGELAKQILKILIGAPPKK